MVEDYLKSLELIRKTPKNKQRALVHEIPEAHYWLTQCKQAQIPFALLKVLIDTSPNFFYWSSPCDFCVEGNASIAIATLQPFVNKHLHIDVVAWWKRHIVSATPPTVQYKEKTLYCFNVLNKPTFFCKEPVRETKPVTKASYCCAVCHLPKKGHVCLGMEPLPPCSTPSTSSKSTSQMAIQTTDQVTKKSTSNTATKRDAYSSMFEPKPLQKESRLEKMFKRQKFE